MRCALFLAAFVAIATATAPAQDVIRAEPVRSSRHPEPALEPFNFDAIGKPTPTPTPTIIRAEPVPRPANSAAPVPTTPSPTPLPRTAHPQPPIRTPQPSMTPFVPEGQAPGTDLPPPQRPAPGAGTLPSTDEAARLLEYANGLYARKLFDLAIPAFEEYLGTPGATERQMAMFRLAESYRAVGRTADARHAYDNVVTLTGRGEFVGPAAYRLGDIYYQEKDFASALPLFRRASTQNKDPKVVLASKFYLGRCLENLRLNAEARNVFEDVLRVAGDNPFREAARLSLARLFTDARQKENAVAQYEAVAKETSQPDLRAECLVRAGLLKLELKRTNQAATDFSDALAIPEIGEFQEIARIGLLQALYDSGQFEKMIAASEAALASVSDAKRPDLLVLVANARRQLGQHAEARAAYTEIAERYPDSPVADEARYQRLVSMYNADEEGVIAAADEFLAKTSNAARRDQVVLLKAEALYKASNFAAAAPIYREIAASQTLSPSYRAEAALKLGWCLMQLRDFAGAAEAYSAFITNHRASKQLPTALVQRAVAYQQMKDYPRALADFSSVISRYPKARERELALQQKALIHGQLQENDAMAAAFSQLLKEYPKTAAAAQANYWIGWARFEAKDYRGAIGPLEKARDADPDQFFERATLRTMLSHYYLEQREPLAKEVAAYLEKGQSEVPPEVLRWLGLSYYQDRNFAQAARYLAPLAERAEGVLRDDLLNAARALEGAGEHAKAADLAERYLKDLSEPYPRANGLVALARARLSSGQIPAAKSAAEEACSLQPEGRVNAEGRTLLGDIAMAEGNPEEAAKIYLGVSLVFDDPTITPHALERAYRAYLKARKDAEAAKTLNTLQSRYPEYRLAEAPADQASKEIQTP